MGKFIYSLRSKRRLILVWLIAGGLAASHSLSKFCRGSTTEFCQAPAEWMLDRVLLLSGVVVAATFFAVLIKRKRNQRLRDGSFRNEPWRYNGSLLQLQGKVVHVVKTRAEYKFKNAITNIVRSLTDNTDPSGRHSHQVLLIHSPQLRKNLTLAVFHNTKFGKVDVRKGDWIDVRGEYLHQRSKEAGVFGHGLSQYGRIHFTHQPKGWIRILNRKPDFKTQPTVRIIAKQLRQSADEDHDSLLRDKTIAPWQI